MIPKDIGSYGGPKGNMFPVEDAKTQIDQAEYNRLLEDVAQGTRTGRKAWVSFLTSAAAAPIGIAVHSGKSYWGITAGAHPTIEKTATGLYTITYPPSFVDGLNESESVSFEKATCEVISLTARGIARAVTTGNVINVQVSADPSASPLVASDLGGSVQIHVDIT